MYNWLSDLSALYLAQDSWSKGIYNTSGVFHLHHGEEGSNAFAIACGASLFAEHIRRFRFTPDLIQRLGQVTDEKGRCLFEESFLNFLQRMKLSVNVKMPQEGTLLLPNEPIMIIEGPHAQVQLLSSAMHQLVWRSSNWATQAAMQRWQKRTFKEENTARSPKYDFNPQGWHARASFIGGANVKSISTTEEALSQEKILQQIRRTYKGVDPIGDIFLNKEQEKNSSVSKTQVEFLDSKTLTTSTLKYTRYQNLYALLLANGRPLVVPSRKGYFRQRTLHQLAAFQKIDLDGYLRNWLIE
jgi:Nicotinate phosphoribosyltransferase (NAPRTase) N-terminal domain